MFETAVFDGKLDKSACSYNASIQSCNSQCLLHDCKSVIVKC